MTEAGKKLPLLTYSFLNRQSFESTSNTGIPFSGSQLKWAGHPCMCQAEANQIVTWQS